MARVLNQRIRVSPRVVCREVDGEAVILDLERGEYFGLDVVGTRIWQLIWEKGNVQGIIDAVLDEYEVSREEVEQDLTDLLARLSEAGLVVLESVAGA